MSVSPDAFLEGLKGNDILVPLTWDQWMAVEPPHEGVGFDIKEVTTRYARNGYDWDIHGRLYTPEKETNGEIAFVFFHGGADSEMVFDETPDGRPGQARALAAQGFKVLTITYPGHYAPGNHWAEPIATRQPIYLLDQALGLDENLDRNEKCTFNVILQGAGQLVDENLAGRRLLVWGHSTGGPMAVALMEHTNNTVFGLLGFGSGGNDGWRRDWREETGAEKDVIHPYGHMSRRSPDTYRASGYEDPEDLCPWGGPEELFQWAENAHRSQMKTGLCDNQHRGQMASIELWPPKTGLPRDEYFSHLENPDPDWLKSISVLFLVGDNDKGHWVAGKDIADKRDMWMSKRYRESGVHRSHVALIPRYGHFGFMELHNEKFVYLWLWALKQGYFEG
ncbi:MAG: alpha/beta fold hydrolase [Rhodospirillales bacterium]|nr:alpha/beta fold hydrolase [Rhodospirillales bacterium]MBT4005752.1 alpha/beta fold hydrolase [Rhodospirillales bacterium]MBT5076692.1 alpha/beta fold hydrolase [Rhodospirillales bacterium]MBT5113407.1 alpha/beta fold hydrolase [Rhodospirillales bacterium]MBT5672233.1 alpha/beta fold hydrolase [Rhodospirillales bacterium]